METYRSKIGLFAYLYVLCFTGLSIYLITHGEVPGGIILAPMSITGIWFFFKTKYIIDKEYLSIKPFGPTIPLKDITEIEKADGFAFSSPALSLKRIMIKYTNGSVFISPDRDADFISRLKQKCANLNSNNLVQQDI